MDEIGGIRIIGDVQRFHLTPGDTIVLNVPGSISNETAFRLKEMIEAQFPGHKALILGGTTLTIIEKDT